MGKRSEIKFLEVVCIVIMNNLEIKNGLVINRENIHLEFKKTFHQNTKSYIRSVCAFANSKGGYVVFGVEDKPRKPIGLGYDFDKFNNYNNKDFSTQIQNCLSINIDFEFRHFEQNIDNQIFCFGVLDIKEHTQKPVICKVTDEKERLREGAIYFRYSAKSEEIKAQDLINLIQIEKDKEKELWVKNIQKMAQIGVNKSGVFSYDGEIFAGDRKVIIDKDIIDKIKFIKEGDFTEKEGAPALILKGEIKNIESLEIIHTPSDPNITYPFEGLKSVENEIKNRNKLKLNNNSKIFVSCKNKSYSLNYLLQKIKYVFDLEKTQNFCWKNNKGTVKKYNLEFIKKCEEVLLNKKKLLTIFK